MTLETKFIALEEFKADEESHTIEGYGSVYDHTDSQNDIVVRGAFAKSLKARTPIMLWQHRTDLIPGVWDVAEETDKGLFMRGRIYKGANVMGVGVYDLLKDKAVKGLSIGYTPKRQEFDRDKGTRKLLEVELHEVSLVTFPANDRAKITRVKSLDGVQVENLHEHKRMIEAALRDAGASNSVADYVASLVPMPALRDAEGEQLKQIANVLTQFTL